MKFSPSAAVQTSTDPCKETYRGPDVESEPETRNVGWLLDHFPSVGYFIDIHSSVKTSCTAGAMTTTRPTIPR